MGKHNPFDIPGIYQTSPEYQRGVEEGKAEAGASQKEMEEKMQGEIDDKQYEIDIRQEAFEDQYKFFEEIKERYFKRKSADHELPKLTLGAFKKELADFKISRRGSEWDVLDMLKESMGKIEPEIKVEIQYLDRPVPVITLADRQRIETAIKLLSEIE